MNLFTAVPEITLPNGLVVPAFEVGTYVCSKGEDGKAVITADGTPWVRIDFEEAKAACEAAGFKLITETQWLAIAFNASQQDCNWTGGKVGEGKLFQGLRNFSVSSAMPGSHEPQDPDEQRWLTLSNGERVCDLNGNVFQWVSDDVQGDEAGLIAKPFTEDSPSLTTAPFQRMQKGMGWRPTAGANWTGFALVRGGYWGSDSDAGAFYLNGDWPDRRSDLVGFRCTK